MHRVEAAADRHLSRPTSRKRSCLPGFGSRVASCRPQRHHPLNPDDGIAALLGHGAPIDRPKDVILIS
ncbi:hypothetical protein CDEST_13519 [Colletotrichum destructivum]|uniref:Uncharacterized protein n=1 Tax=Colletotrichum destructivum TaxID=34406 RepID=A0AAX4IZA0_9PEZI|nr:hypothetical protein CDEST_13519 [Colletotrichum destructivum]